MKAILISVDTLRADHVGAYGWQFNTTPRIDEWADRGVLFDRCYATDVPTPPSYTSIFSGRYGVHNGIFGFQNPSTYRAGSPMVQTLFEAEGHDTCAISNLFYPCPWLLPGWRTVMPPGLRFQRGTALEVTNTAIEWLEANGKHDFFLFVHYWEPHQPYNKAPDEHRKLFPTEEYGEAAPEADIMFNNPIMKDFHRYYHQGGEGEPDITPAEVMARYDSQIHYADAEVGRLFSWLDQNSLEEETTVILTSDHGEAFGEYGSFDHLTCYENISHVPLIIRAPGRFPEGKRVSGLVCGTDIYATILELAGIDIPDSADSRSLVECSVSETAAPHDSIVTDTNALCAQRMIVRNTWGLVHTINRGPFDHVKPWELFELNGDPENEVSKENPDIVSDLKDRMEAWLLRMTGGDIDPLVIAAQQGGWTFGNGCFVKSVMEHLDIAAGDPQIWESIRHCKGASSLDLISKFMGTE